MIDEKNIFYLKEEPSIYVLRNGQVIKGNWVVQTKPQPSKKVAFFVGPTKEHAPLVAGDYVEFLNEKYFDKNINEAWPQRTKKQLAEYYMQRAYNLLLEDSVEWNRTI